VSLWPPPGLPVCPISPTTCPLTLWLFVLGRLSLAVHQMAVEGTQCQVRSPLPVLPCREGRKQQELRGPPVPCQARGCQAAAMSPKEQSLLKLDAPGWVPSGKATSGTVFTEPLTQSQDLPQSPSSASLEMAPRLCSSEPQWVQPEPWVHVPDKDSRDRVFPVGTLRREICDGIQHHEL
jgi:hypothetical protein